MIVLGCFLCTGIASAQHHSSWSFRLGASVSFGIHNMNANTVGIGGIAGAENRFHKLFALEAEGSYTYFTGDKTLFENARNKAYAIPLLAGLKTYLLPQVYLSLRTGAAMFLLNEMPEAQVRLAYGAAAGFNLPAKINRINTQIGYTGFTYNGIHRGYTTLAMAIIIN